MNAQSHRSPRRSVRLRCEAVRERGFQRLGDVALDISASGMMVRTRTRVLTGEAVIVSFFEPTESRWYDTEATVARVVHGRRASDRGSCLGLRFDSLDAHQRTRLAAAIERCYWGTFEPGEEAGADRDSHDDHAGSDPPHGLGMSDATQ